jgi:hypothetical protein
MLFAFAASASAYPAILAQAVPADNMIWFIVLGAFGFVVGLAAIVWHRSRSTAPPAKEVDDFDEKDDWGNSSVDGDKEMEWLRKHNNIINKKRPKKTSNGANREKSAEAPAPRPEPVLTKEIQLSGLTDLPFNSILRLEYPTGSNDLPVSEEPDLMDAIEQALDEFNDDEEMKELSMRIIAAYKTRNSVEALSQLALYDLSANVRSSAVVILGEFDHQSVFETIVLAGADPTREVRASAARVMARLGFNRADAWTRIALLDEEGRMRQVARAAIEAGLAERYFDRLIHSDYKQAYEAFAVITLLLKARETESIAQALESYPNMMVRVALIHLIKVNNMTDALPYLLKLSTQQDLPKEVFDAVGSAIEKFSPEPEEV